MNNNIDLDFIRKTLSSMIQDTMSGSVKYEEVEAKISLPKQVVEVLKHVSEVQGIPFETMVSKAASQGISSHLQELQKIGEPAMKLPEGMEGLSGFENMPLPEGFGNKFGELKDMVAQFQSIADQVKTIEERLKDGEKKE